MPKVSIYLNGEISPFNEPEWGLFSNQFIVDQISAAPKGFDEVELTINSPGGDVVEGFAMYDYLRSLGVKITTKGVGRVASIATVIFLAGDDRQIAENTEFMIHNPWTFAEGDADSLEKSAEQLREIENKIASFYAGIIGAKEADLLALMAEETTFTAQQAIDMGFAMGVLEPANKAFVQSRILAGAVACKATINLTNTMKKPKKELSISDRIKALVKRMQSNSAQESQDSGVKALDVALEDGTVVDVETGDREEIQVGDAVTLEGEPVEDNTWVLADGRSIVTVDGAISEIMEAEGGEGDESGDESNLAETVANAINEALQPVLDFIENQATVNKTQEQVNAQLTEAMELVTSGGFEASEKDNNKPQNYINRTKSPKKEPLTHEQENDKVVDNVNKSVKELFEAQKKGV